ncbi:FAS-associated death domain protein-like [Ptychodera flava]|uniref:FAS-associated death domain protein-like n=1 Tax=Ptychodera flava TaxID=63121 RepID=UPI003969F581
MYISFSDGDSGEKFNENIESLTKNLKDQLDDDLRIDGAVRAAVSDTPHTRVTEDNLDTVVDNIGKDWKRLGRKLGITDPDLDVLQMNNSHDVKEAIRQMLRQWREDNGKMATKEKLKEALVNAKRRDIADEIL